jgi:hypothetical protein
MENIEIIMNQGDSVEDVVYGPLFSEMPLHDVCPRE